MRLRWLYLDALEEAGANYVDVARMPNANGGVPAMMSLLDDGLRYAFPNAMARIERKVPRCVALHERVANRPRIAAYLASERRIVFNEQGIFRHYRELDAPAGRGR